MVGGAHGEKWGISLSFLVIPYKNFPHFSPFFTIFPHFGRNEGEIKGKLPKTEDLEKIFGKFFTKNFYCLKWSQICQNMLVRKNFLKKNFSSPFCSVGKFL